MVCKKGDSSLSFLTPVTRMAGLSGDQDEPLDVSRPNHLLIGFGPKRSPSPSDGVPFSQEVERKMHGHLAFGTSLPRDIRHSRIGSKETKS